MRYIIILLLSTGALISQNIIDPPTLIKDTTSNKDVIVREQTEFLRGWNWGSEGEKLDDALYINAYHDYPNSGNDKADSVYIMEPLLWPPEYITGRSDSNSSYIK